MEGRSTAGPYDMEPHVIQLLGRIFVLATLNGENPYYAMNNALIEAGIDPGHAMATVCVWSCRYEQVRAEPYFGII